MVVLVVGMMVFPLPLGMLDALLVCNITLSLSLLICAVYLSEPEKFTSLPTILLLATLFRLGLNISTTRQLLAEGEAPDVVIAFGNFVVSGNLVVGLVIFLIVTLVQFLVVAKGAERVAEVAARFTLDAMPGKQMAIDADIRAGILSVSEAKEKRLELQRESRLYGALDGAMKFVKGDAIAGLVITAVNIGAGLLVGVAQQGLSLLDAAHKYTIFTVGDGLVSQIPALLTAVAAGIAVTRVSEKEGSSVGREMWSQLGKEPQALATTAVVLVCLGCMPGLSFPMFAGMGALLGFAAMSVRKKLQAGAATKRDSIFRPKVLPGLALQLSADAVRVIQQENILAGSVQGIRSAVFHRYGLIIQDFPFEIDANASGVQAAILFQGVPLFSVQGQGTVSSDPSVNPATAPERTLSFSEEILQKLEIGIERFRSELVDDTQTRMLMELHEASCEDLINSVVPKLINVTTLTTLLRQLVREQVSIKSFSTILQAIAEFFAKQERAASSGSNSGKGATAGGTLIQRELLSEVRAALSRSITSQVTGGTWKLSAWVLEAGLDHLFSRAAASNSPVKTEICEILEEELEAKLHAGGKSPLVIIATRFARYELVSTLAAFGDRIKVIAAEELANDVELSILGEIQILAESSENEFVGSKLANGEMSI